MTVITFRQATGETKECELEAGISLMELAIKNDVEGILAECGGAAACATCHVHLTPEWEGKVGDISAVEEDMLEFAVDVRPGESRLSCQITLTDDMAGLTVNLPSAQF